MCGIAGYFSVNRSIEKSNLEKMTDVLQHRGPSDAGYFVDQMYYGNIGLGHRRLSILDLSSDGHQPMEYKDLVMVYNGEVYNFKEIREDLIGLGHCFHSNTDSEVVLKAYSEWGDKAIERFNGMFAIAIFDKTRKRITLIRDRVGVKPLYWYYKNGVFLFGSELKSFHQNSLFEKKINKKSLDNYLQYGYIQQPDSIFLNTYKLESGHLLHFEIERSKIECIKYWDVIDSFKKPKLDISLGEAVAECESLILKSSKYRLISDVPVGIFLSGGYDSSLITALIQKNSDKKIKTFTLGFDDIEFNEARYAKLIADYLNTDHHEYICTQEEGINVLLEVLPTVYDEPFGDTSAIPTLLLCKFASQHVTVALSADGGDEIFGGYSKYSNIKKISNFHINKKIYAPIYKLMPKFGNKKIDKISQILNYSEKSHRMKCLEQIFNNKEINKDEVIYTRQLGGESFFDELFLSDFDTFLPDDILKKVDYASMSVSLEAREPLLDFNLIEFVAQLPDNFKINSNTNKVLLKNIVHKYIDKKLVERPKMGFGVPISKWLRNSHELIEELFELIKNNTELAQYNFDLEFMREKFLRGGDALLDKKVYLLIIYSLWHKKWMN